MSGAGGRKPVSSMPSKVATVVAVKSFAPEGAFAECSCGRPVAALFADPFAGGRSRANKSSSQPPMSLRIDGIDSERGVTETPRSVDSPSGDAYVRTRLLEATGAREAPAFAASRTAAARALGSVGRGGASSPSFQTGLTAVPIVD